jgi:Tol biopolymer transport system component
MGEVYKARDTRLDRVVAVKVLVGSVEGNGEWRTRFAREARAISQLDHPNICALYDVGEENGLHFLVIQYLDGETLAERLTRGPVPVDQALTIGRDVAGALDKAHRAGVVHRDLKPANIMLTRTGAKLLDFGVAKLRGPVKPIGMSTFTNLTGGTAAGSILGTVPYMAPEQLEGREVDPRSDVFAFGVVMYEALTGRRPFDGASVAAVIGSILKDDPTPIVAHEPKVPAVLAQIVETCLAKDPDERWQSTADLRRQLMWLAPASTSTGATAAAVAPSGTVRISWRTLVLGAVCIAAASALTAAWIRGSAPAPGAPVIRFPMLPPGDRTFATPTAQVPSTQMAVSPDGRHVAFVASSPTEPAGLWLRALNETTPRLLPGTEGAAYPFWSPDSRSIGFFTQNRMKRVDVAGGTSQVVCDVDLDARGGTWNADNVIVFARSTRSGLSRVSAATGVVTPLLDLRAGEHSYRWPAFLPDNEHFLFHVRGAEGRGVYLGRLGSHEVTQVLDDAPYAAIYSAGFLLTVREGTLLAYPFDADQRRIASDAVRVTDNVGGSTTLRASFAASPAGVLAYAGPLSTLSRLQWVDRAGRPVGEPSEVSDYVNFRASPDGRTIAVTRVDAMSDTTDIWRWDVALNTQTLFTTDPGTDTSPVWSPDGREIMFRSDRAGGAFPFVRPASGGERERQVASIETLFLTDRTADGRLVFHGSVSGTSYDVGMVAPSAGAKVEYVAASGSTEMDGRVSPNGRWLAYSSDESRRMQVYLKPLPDGGALVVSTNGGSEPHWRRDGRELFYLAADRTIMSVSIDADGHPGVAQPLFRTDVLFPGSIYRMNYDVNADGTRFLVNTPIAGTAASPITVVVNWPAGMAR